VIRFLFPLFLVAVAVCCLIAYLRAEAEVEGAQWNATCATIEAGIPPRRDAR
jgi:hypothetical protein